MYKKINKEFKRWIFTIGVFLGSIGVIDGIATLFGTILVVSGLFEDFSILHLTVFILGTYIFWFYGINANLKANWNALEQEGVSTNVPSKALYDFSKSRKYSLRVQKITAGFGYVITELTKELPYYVGAFGAASFLEEITNKEAIIFLGGANIGAGIYEYIVARGTNQLLFWRRKSI